MKTLNDLLKTKTLNVEELMQIKGAEEMASAGCGSLACSQSSCANSACTSGACDKNACSSSSCFGATCRSQGCIRSMDKTGSMGGGSNSGGYDL